MNQELLSALVDCGLVTDNTLVYAKVRTIGLGGDPTIVKKNVYWYPDMPAGAILDIEGMSPERFAQAYNIKPNGQAKLYKKRGRKPRANLA